MQQDIPFSPPYIDQNVIKEVTECLQSGWITTGARTRKLEEKVKEYTNVNSVVCVNSWTSGANLIWKWMGLMPGDEVIIPVYTYSATALSVIHSGATPVYVDVNDDFLINTGRIASFITERTKAIMPVDIGGLPCDIDLLLDIVNQPEIKTKFNPTSEVQRKFGRIAIVCDAAHSLGAYYKGKPKGHAADITIFSFHSVKNLTTAEGGAICINLNEPFSIEEETKVIRLMTLNGQTKDAFTKLQVGGWKYDIVLDGLKVNMPDICAAIGLAQFAKFESHILPERRHIFKHYHTFFSQLDWAILPTERDSKRITAYHLYMLRIAGINENQRDQIMADIAAKGVAVNVHFIPLPLLTFFKEQGLQIKNFPNAYKQYACEISLPIYPQLTEAQVDYVIETVKNAVEKQLVRKYVSAMV